MVLLKTRSRDDEGGAIAILVAISAVVLFSLAALVVDLGHARDVRRQSQTAADASALAAANAVYSQTYPYPLVALDSAAGAVAVAKNYAAENFGVSASDWSSCNDPGELAYVVPATTPCISFDSAAHPERVRVRIPNRDAETGIGAVANTSRIDIASVAVAKITQPSGPLCGLCVLGSATHDLQNGDAYVSGGDIDFNGSVAVSNNGLVATNGGIYVQDEALGPSSNYTPAPVEGVAAISDPLEDMALPPDMSALSAKSNPCTQGPGIYTGFNFSGACTFTPGLYVIRSGDWKLSGDSDAILGSGVTLYFTCSTTTTPAAPRACNSGESGATLTATGNGSLRFSAPTGGPLQGLAVVYDRNNNALLKLAGNGSTAFSGTMYGTHMHLQMNGNGCSTVNALVVVGELEMNGNPSCLRTAYSGPQNAQQSPRDLHLDQ